MKKFVSLLLTGVLAFGLLAGCGNSGTAASPAPEQPASRWTLLYKDSI